MIIRAGCQDDFYLDGGMSRIDPLHIMMTIFALGVVTTATAQMLG